jgi:hypothetical protein
LPLPNDSLAANLRQIREELFPVDGVREVALRLGIPEQSWTEYESGATVPAEVLLAFVILTGVEPNWLLNGTGRKFRDPRKH